MLEVSTLCCPPLYQLIHHNTHVCAAQLSVRRVRPAPANAPRCATPPRAGPRVCLAHAQLCCFPLPASPVCRVCLFPRFPLPPNSRATHPQCSARTPPPTTCPHVITFEISAVLSDALGECSTQRVRRASWSKLVVSRIVGSSFIMCCWAVGWIIGCQSKGHVRSLAVIGAGQDTFSFNQLDTGRKAALFP